MKFLIKILKISVIGFLVLGLVLTALYFYADNKQDIGADFRAQIETGSELEAHYLKKGRFDVEKVVFEAEKPIEKYSIFYPSDLAKSQKNYPVIFVVNGTGGKATKYEALFEHYASWGFIVVGTQDKGTGTGHTTMQALDFLLAENEAVESIFFQKIDKENIGITGFSQGGAAVMNVITNDAYKGYFKTAVPLSPVSEKTTREMTDYNYDSSKVQVPIMVLAGTEGKFEVETVIPLSELNVIFDKIPEQKLVARRSGMDHDKMMYSASGYVTAWSMWQLQGDTEAGKAFVGENAEILMNDMYQDVRIKMGEMP